MHNITLITQLMDAIHNKKNFGKKLYCNGFIPLSPVKPGTPKSPHIDTDAQQQENGQPAVYSDQGEASEVLNNPSLLVKPLSLPAISTTGSSTPKSSPAPDLTSKFSDTFQTLFQT